MNLAVVRSLQSDYEVSDIRSEPERMSPLQRSVPDRRKGAQKGGREGGSQERSVIDLVTLEMHLEITTHSRCVSFYMINGY